jgi:hypothetical protein
MKLLHDLKSEANTIKAEAALYYNTLIPTPLAYILAIYYAIVFYIAKFICHIEGHDWQYYGEDDKPSHCKRCLEEFK